MLKNYLNKFDDGVLSIVDIIIIFIITILKWFMLGIAIVSATAFPDAINFIGSTACFVVGALCLRCMREEMSWQY